MEKIAVIGSGTMGNGIAHVFSQFGFKVSLIDISQEALNKGMDTIKKNLDRQVLQGIITAENKGSTLTRITTSTAYGKRLEGAELILEAALKI